MKLASFQRIAESPAAPVRTGVVTANGLVDVSAVVAALEVAPVAPGAHNQGMVRLLAGGAAALQRVREAAARATPQDTLALADARLLAPIPRPGKVVAIGRNYADHAKESGVAAPEAPRIIFKLPSSVVGPGTTVRAAQVKKLDFEIELGVVMGRVAKDVGVEQALDHVAGYTVLNDLSAREFQFDVSPAATTFAKSMDGFCPLGPWIVTADELPDPQNLRLRTWLNGELMQDGNTHDMVHGVRQIVAYASRFMTLEPGDVIATGTPAGVGLGRNPPLWLKPGDRMALEIEGVGTLEHDIG